MYVLLPKGSTTPSDCARILKKISSAEKLRCFASRRSMPGTPRCAPKSVGSKGLVFGASGWCEPLLGGR